MHERGIPARSIVVAVLGAAAVAFALAHAAPPASPAPPGDVPRGLSELSALFSPSGFTDGYWTGHGSGIAFSQRRDPEAKLLWLDIRTPYGTQSLPFRHSPEGGGEAGTLSGGLSFSQEAPIRWAMAFGARVLITDSMIRVVVPRADGEPVAWTFRAHGSGEWHASLPDGRTVSAAGRAWAEETEGSGR